MSQKMNPSGIVASALERASNKTIQCPHCNNDLLLLKAAEEPHWPQWAVSRARELKAQYEAEGGL